MEARLAYILKSVKYLPQKHQSLILIESQVLEEAQWLRVLAALPKNPVLIHNPHGSLQPSVIAVPGDLRSSLAPGTKVVHRYPFRQSTHTLNK